MKKILILILFLYCTFNTNAQKNYIDSLQNIIENSNVDTVKAKAYIHIANYYTQRDSSKFFTNIKKALIFSKKANYSIGEADIYASYGMFYSIYTDFNLAISYFEKSAKICKKHNLKKELVTALGNAGNVHCYQGDYEKGLKNYLEALDVMYELDNKNWIAIATNNIGNVYYLQKNYDKALKYYEEALKTHSQLKNKEGIALATGNIGIIYFEKGETHKALMFYLKAEKMRKVLSNKQQLANLYANIGDAYRDIKDFEKATSYYEKSLKLAKQIGDKNNLANLYSSISQYYIDIKKYNMARSYVLKALEITKSNKLQRTKSTCYRQLSILDSAGGNYLGAFENYKKADQIQDSIFDKEKAENLNEMHTKYESEKTEKENKILLQKNTIDKITIKKQKILSYSFAIGAFLFLILAVGVLFSMNKIKSAHRKLSTLYSQLNQQNEEITTQSENLELANKEITKQKNITEHALNHVNASINYAKRIQNAALPDTKIIDKYTQEHFVIFKPRDTVSGDFYWVKFIKNHLLIAVADCTGHGVPGAFVSMLGISLLNDITAHSEITQTNFVLDELRNRIKESLGHNEDSSQKDGMDISFCAINIETLEMQYSGAHNPVYIITKKDGIHSLTQLRADKMPIGIHRKEIPFTMQKFQLKKNDTLYLTSDGYQDQFGGRHGEKFKRKRLQQLLLKMQGRQLIEQKNIIEEQFITWKGEMNQIDDILLVGIKI